MNLSDPEVSEVPPGVTTVRWTAPGVVLAGLVTVSWDPPALTVRLVVTAVVPK